MSLTRPLLRELETDQMDRRVIRVEFPPAQAGIAAALRRAFSAPRGEYLCDDQFGELLRRLN
ncbi:MAG: hypothetical protein ABR588_11150 [Sphingomicrobium sp.]